MRDLILGLRESPIAGDSSQPKTRARLTATVLSLGGCRRPDTAADNAACVGYTRTMLDIPPRLRRVFTVAALGGLIFIMIGSLASGSDQQIGLDKLVHSAGYALLGMLVVLGLPPIWYLPALLGIAGAGVGLEYAQKVVIAGRSSDMKDVVANVTGLIAGMLVGFIGRMLWGYVGGELAARADRQRMRRFADGQYIFRQGEPSGCFYIIRYGVVEILVEKDGVQTEIARAHRGEVIGEMGVIEDQPRSATAVARGKTALYRLDRSDLESPNEPHDHPAMTIARTLAARLRATNARLTSESPQAGDAGECDRKSSAPQSS